MDSDSKLDDAISTWLEETAPSHLPGRVLDATFERTRQSRQQLRRGWVLGSVQVPRLIPALGGAVVVVMAAALTLNVIPLVGPGEPPTPSPSATASPSTSPGPTTPLWPQTSLEEVRQAQALADAGDPRYTWQVAPYLVDQIGQNHPYVARNPGGDVVDAEIFSRFLEEELGWDEFLWDEAFAHRDNGPGEVVYIRCAPGLTNPLYPADPERAGCAPTIDEFRYETVQISVAQLDRQGPSGIWVVTGWEMVEPVAQADPRVVEADATALLEAFLQARIDGEGAEEFVDFADDVVADVRVDQGIPLLYATSAGAPYERSEFELVDGPLWPEGLMQFEVRLFAENGATVVEQVFTLEGDDTGRLRLVYDFQPRGPAGPILATTENGKAVPVEYAFLDGAVTYRAAAPAGPWPSFWGQAPDVANIVGADDQRLLSILADPRPLEHPGCVKAPAPADAEALARSIGSDPNLKADAPVAVTIGGIPALQIDLQVAPDASACAWQMPVEDLYIRFGGEDRARLYLLDLPRGSARVLAIAIFSGDEDGFERALELAAPIVESIEFHTP